MRTYLKGLYPDLCFTFTMLSLQALSDVEDINSLAYDMRYDHL